MQQQPAPKFKPSLTQKSNIMNFNKFTKLWLILLVFPLVFTVSCSEDDDPIVPIASFQLAIDEADFFKVQFSNFSENATAYAWDFGDGTGTSTEESPSYTYSASGDYTVKLTASDEAGVSAEFTKDLTITDPDEALTLLAGSVSKTWKLVREGIGMGVGQNAERPASEWGLTNDGNRNCIYDDEFIFHRDGTYEYNDNGTFWGEYGVFNDTDVYEICFDAVASNMVLGDGTDVSKWLSGTHAYTYDVANNQITLSGLGAWIGISKFGTEDYAAGPVESTMFASRLADGGDTGVDTLVVSFNYGEYNYWEVTYVSYADASTEPDMAVTKPAPDFTFAINGLEVTFTNTSKNADSYSWDFGDGNSSTDESPVHTYADAGCYAVVLSASGQGLTETKAQEALIAAPATFTAADLSNANGKVWTLNSEGSYKVGPAPGSGEWWGGVDAAGVAERACQMDDEFIFADGGVFTYDDKGEIWAEGSLGVENGCYAASALAAPFSGFGSATHSFTVDATTITVTGTGAFIGWYPAYNGGEIGSTDTELPTTITYTVHEYIVSPCKEVLVLYVETGAGTFWTMTMQSTI